MKKIFLTIITLFAFFITFDTVKASCSKLHATCNHYYFDASGDKFNLEIGKDENGERYAIVEAGGNAQELELQANGNTYSIMTLGNNAYNNIISFSIDAKYIDEMADTMSFNKTCPDTMCMVSFFSGSEGSGTTNAVPDSSIPDPENSSGTISKCYFEDATSCKRYSGLLDANKNSFAVEIGNSNSYGNYFIVSYTNFASLYGTDFGEVGNYGHITTKIGTSDNNYTVYQVAKDSFKLESTNVFANYPNKLKVSSNNLGEGMYQYTIIIDKSSGNYNPNTGLTGTDDNVGYTGMDCYGLLGPTSDPNAPAYWLQKALQVIRYAGIAALFIFSTIDFVKAIVNQDNDALRKAISTTVKRFIYAILIFFVPILTENILRFFGVYGTCAL